MSIRKPVVAGKFYLREKEGLEKQISEIYNKEKDNIDLSLSKKNIIGGVVPHAGYMFSASKAVHFFDLLRNSEVKYDTIFIINPNHSGYGQELSFDSNSEWKTPLGLVSLDTDFAKIMNIPVSDVEQKMEHSGEVMLPLLQYFLPYEFKIAPITMTHQYFSEAKILAKSIYQANKQLGKEILIIASSDFSHFVNPDIGFENDQLVLDKILNLNSFGVQEEIVSKNISVCGYGPIMTLIEYSKLFSNNAIADVLARGNSGEVIPSDEVVDYISILFSS
ncbi:MAG: AmmeMemoRadiSam system protein B [Bacteroidales bacterium]|jgi:AmmeMemoRadiSam system protein B|nr:AmmeMemoRadiSam system protein B [Bacteroidales bacterium]